MEAQEPAIALRPMTPGSEVIKDHGHTGLGLRRHPVSCLRDMPTQRRVLSRAEAMAPRARTCCASAGLMLVRQRPGSARGVKFITLEDETDLANLVVWPKVFEAHRRIVLGAGMVGVQGRIPRVGTVVHFDIHRIEDLSRELASVGARDGAAFPLTQGCRDKVRDGAVTGDLREAASAAPRSKEIFIRDLDPMRSA